MTDEYLTLTEVAGLAEVGISAASNWRSRHADFPRPHLVSGQERFAAGEIAQWLGRRRIPRNALKAGEEPGTTYGDRLSRIRGPVTRAEPDPTARLWTVMDELRGPLDAASAVELVLALLYLKRTDRVLWQSLIASDDGRTARELLGRVAPSAWPGGREAPLLPPVDSSVDRSLRTVIGAIDSIDFDETSQVAGRLSDALLERVERDTGRLGGRFTPPSVARCLVEALGGELSGTVYDPFGGSGELLTAAAGRGDVRLFGQLTGERSLRVAWLNTALHGSPATLRLGKPSVFDDKFAGETFDFILTNPAFNIADQAIAQRSWRFGTPPRHNANFAWLQHVVEKLAPRGRAAVLMPSMAGWVTGNREAEIRRRMVESGVVEGVVALPSFLFPLTSIATIIWLLRGADPDASPPGELRLVDATSIGTMVGGTHRVLDDQDVERVVSALRQREHDDDFARTVGLDEIRANDHVLHPPVYLRQSAAASTRDLRAEAETLTRELDDLRSRATRSRPDEYLREIAAASEHTSWEQVPLGELCAVLAGPAQLDRGGPGTPRTPLVLPRNVQDSRISHERLDTVAPEVADRNMRFELVEGDIVFIRVGTLGRFGQVRDTEAGWLVGPGCMRLRPTDCDSGYLTHYLGTSDTYQWLQEHATGTAIRNISTDTLKELPVLLPPLAVQREIANAVGAFDEQISIHEEICRTGRKMRDLILPMLTTRHR